MCVHVCVCVHGCVRVGVLHMCARARARRGICGACAAACARASLRARKLCQSRGVCPCPMTSLVQAYLPLPKKTIICLPNPPECMGNHVTKVLEPSSRPLERKDRDTTGTWLDFKPWVQNSPWHHELDSLLASNGISRLNVAAYMATLQEVPSNPSGISPDAPSSLPDNALLSTYPEEKDDDTNTRSHPHLGV
jgi:hypothetical protein